MFNHQSDQWIFFLLQIKALTSLSMILKQKSIKEILPIIPQWVCLFPLDSYAPLRIAYYDPTSMWYRK